MHATTLHQAYYYNVDKQHCKVTTMMKEGAIFYDNM